MLNKATSKAIRYFIACSQKKDFFKLIITQMCTHLSFMPILFWFLSTKHGQDTLGSQIETLEALDN